MGERGQTYVRSPNDAPAVKNLYSIYGPLSSVDLGVVFWNMWEKLREIRAEIDMLIGGASVLDRLATGHGFDEMDWKGGIMLGARMWVHAVNIEE